MKIGSSCPPTDLRNKPARVSAYDVCGVGTAVERLITEVVNPMEFASCSSYA